MRAVILTISLLAIVLGVALPYPLRDAVEFHSRDGLPDVLSKLREGREVRVAYFGGSITAAAGWRVKSLAWLQAQYPKAKVSEINAAIGGTGSDLGVYRLQFDVLRHKPDLVFVEFAVNDGGAEPVEIQRCMEGIVRQCWTADPSMDLCFVYTLTGGMVADLRQGHFPRAASSMEAIADHYGIPSVHFGVEVVRRVVDGSLIFKASKTPNDAEREAIGSRMVFSNDDVHPLDAGHELYARTLAKHLLSLTTEPASASVPHALVKPLVADHYQAATMLSLERAKPGDGWTRLDSTQHPVAKSFTSRMPVVYKAEKPGTKLSFRFKGTGAAIYDLVGPDCGQLLVRVDGGNPRKVLRIDGYCTYHRLALLRIASGLPDAVHTVEIELDATIPNKPSILFPDNRGDMERNPAKYAGGAWYAGSLMLLGELQD